MLPEINVPCLKCGGDTRPDTVPGRLVCDHCRTWRFSSSPITREGMKSPSRSSVQYEVAVPQRPVWRPAKTQTARQVSTPDERPCFVPRVATPGKTVHCESLPRERL